MSQIRDTKHEAIIRRWSELPEDILEEITACLASADRVRFSAVCRNFFQHYKSLLSNPDHDHWAIDNLPWLLRQCEDRTELFDPIHQNLYSVHELRLSPRKALASKHGWLFFSQENHDTSYTRVSFYSISVFTKQIIKLPDLYLPRQSGTKFIRLAAFSSAPSSPDCVYFVLHQTIDSSGVLRISTIQHDDEEWRDKSCHVRGLSQSAVYHEDCFYWVTGTHGALESYNVVSRIWTTHTMLGLPLRPIYVRRCHMVVSEGKLLLVCLDVTRSGSMMDKCSVHEFDPSSRRWVQRTSLGDHALFLGSSSFSVAAIGTRAREFDIANKVYYYHPRECNELRYYSLEDGECHKSTNRSWFGNVDAGMWIEPHRLPTLKF